MRKRLNAISWLQLLLPVLIFHHILILAVDLNHLQPTWLSSLDSHHPQYQNLQEGNHLQKNTTTLGIDCGSSHYACPDENTCCPLNYKCCASQSSDGMMACCPAGLDVSYNRLRCANNIFLKLFELK